MAEKRQTSQPLQDSQQRRPRQLQDSKFLHWTFLVRILCYVGLNAFPNGDTPTV